MSGRAGAGVSSIPKAREDIAVRIVGSCIPTKHPSCFRTNSSPRKLGSAAKGSPLRKEVTKEKDHTKVGSFRLARAAGACCIRQRIVGRSIRSCGRKPRPRGGSVSDTTEKVAGNAGNARRFTRLVGIWAPQRRLYAPLDSGHLALLSPSCRLPVASLSLFWHFQPPVAPLSLACRFPVAVLSLPCRSPVASLSLACRPPVAILSLPVASCRFLSPCYFLPGALLSLSCRSPVVPSCCSPVAISCCLPVALLSLACRLPAASLSPPCRLPVASLSPNLVTCRSPVACLSLACRLPVVFLPPPFCLPVASLSPPCRPTW